MFMIWIPIALTQIILFSIFLSRFKKEPEVFEESIDIIPMYIYNNMVYWKQDTSLMRAPYSKSSVDINKALKIDQLNSDLLPSELMEIIKKLEKA